MMHLSEKQYRLLRYINYYDGVISFNALNSICSTDDEMDDNKSQDFRAEVINPLIDTGLLDKCDAFEAVYMTQKGYGRLYQALLSDKNV